MSKMIALAGRGGGQRVLAGSARTALSASLSPCLCSSHGSYHPVPLARPASSSSSLSSSSSSAPPAKEEGKCRPEWRSDAEDRIKEVPVIEVDGRLAICDGGSGALGHPLEYMTLDTVNPGPVVCKYCGLRFVKKPPTNRYGKKMKFEA